MKVSVLTREIHIMTLLWIANRHFTLENTNETATLNRFLIRKEELNDRKRNYEVEIKAS